MKRAGGKLRSLQKNQSVFSTTCQYPPLSGPIRRSTPSAFSPAICFSTALGGIPIRLASAVALSVLSCESRAMIFSLLFEFILLLSIVNDIQKFVCKFDVCNFYNTIFFCWIIKNIDADISMVDIVKQPDYDRMDNDLKSRHIKIKGEAPNNI